MADALFLISQYQTWAYGLLAVLAVLYIRSFLLAWNDVNRTLFGLEKENALQKQNVALAMLIILGALAVFVYMNEHVLVPNMEARKATPVPTALPPTSTPISANGGPLVVDSGGCNNPNVTLTRPKSGERLSGAIDVQGTADITSLAFYTLELNGQQTGGTWLPVAVGNQAVHNGLLGRFDTSAYPPGDYVLRLVAKDTVGNYPRPCEVLVTIVAEQATATPLP
jgi:hypothetical protein